MHAKPSDVSGVNSRLGRVQTLGVSQPSIKFYLLKALPMFEHENRCVSELLPEQVLYQAVSVNHARHVEHRAVSLNHLPGMCSMHAISYGL